VWETVVPILYHDYETYSLVNLKKVGAWRYSVHPSTGIWCMAYCVDDGPIKIWKPGDPIPPEFIEAEHNPDWKTSAHNDQFERYITMHIANPRYGLPLVPNEHRLCSMAAALTMSLPGDLDEARQGPQPNQSQGQGGASLDDADVAAAQTTQGGARRSHLLAR
jgi:DNA polymerase